MDECGWLAVPSESNSAPLPRQAGGRAILMDDLVMELNSAHAGPLASIHPRTGRQAYCEGGAGGW